MNIKKIKNAAPSHLWPQFLRPLFLGDRGWWSSARSSRRRSDFGSRRRCRDLFTALHVNDAASGIVDSLIGSEKSSGGGCVGGWSVLISDGDVTVHEQRIVASMRRGRVRVSRSRGSGQWLRAGQIHRFPMIAWKWNKRVRTKERFWNKSNVSIREQ